MSKKQNKRPSERFLGTGLIFGKGKGITNDPSLFGNVSIAAFIVIVLSTKI